MNGIGKLFFDQWCALLQVVGSLLLATAFGILNASALSVTPVTSDNGYAALEVQWTDASGLPRTAVMVNQTNRAPYTGYLRRYTYQVNGVNRVCTGTQNYATGGNLEFSGDGFVQNHGAETAQYPGGSDNSSGNGAGVSGTTTVTLLGAHHAIITYSMPANPIYGQSVPTTVQWFFADGSSHPIFAIAQDARGTTGNLGCDSRSPYGDMAYDGDGVEANVGGCSYGDTYKFVTLASNPEQVTKSSGWQDTVPNSIPYAMQWANPATVDAEMGHVATVPISVCDQGEDPQNYPVIDPRGTSQPSGPMLTDESWAYQILNDNFPASGPTTIKRLAWGGNYGRVGGWDDSSPGYTDPRYPDGTSTSLTQYNQHSNDPVGDTESGSRANGLLMAYSVFVVFGTHNGSYTNGAVGHQVLQMQNAALATLSASTGTVRTTGPAGVGTGSSATINYTPPGYDPIYSTWEINALANSVNAALTPAVNAPLDHPLFAIDAYTANQLPGNLAVGAGLTNAGVDYFATVDTNSQRLWITVNRVVTNALNLVINGSGGGGGVSAPVITSFSPTSGSAGTSVVILGTNFGGATAVTFNGVAAGFVNNSTTQITAAVPPAAASGFLTVTTPVGTALSASAFTVRTTATNLPIYADSLLNGYLDYSWATNVNDFNSAPVYSGSYSISVTAAAFTALSLYHTNFNTSPYESLDFWINGGTAGAPGLQVMGVLATNGGQNYGAIYNLPTLPINAWAHFNIPLAALGVANVTNCQGFWIWPTTSGATSFYVDSIQLNTATLPALAMVTAKAGSSSVVLQLSGLSGQSYWIETSTNLMNWTTVSTNSLVYASINVTNPVISGARQQYWRAFRP